MLYYFQSKIRISAQSDHVQPNRRIAVIVHNMSNIQAQELRLTFINVHERFNLTNISDQPFAINHQPSIIITQ